MTMDDATIKKIAKQAARETIRELNLVKKRGNGKKSFRDVVELLESIPDRRDKIEQDEMDIADMKQEKFDTTTWHDIKRPEGPQLDDNIRHLQKISNRERTQKRTEKLIRRIETAMEKMKTDPDYVILEMRYLQGMSNEQIAEKLNYGSTTVWRRHNRLIRKLERKLFGADALDI
jgi:RNA polymerase sigma factor (sigma-70 family)